MSYPKKGCHTKRYKTIEVKVDNMESNMTFGGGDTDLDLLESVCVQHEIDHLNGMRILDGLWNLPSEEINQRLVVTNLLRLKKTMKNKR